MTTRTRTRKKRTPSQKQLDHLRNIASAGGKALHAKYGSAYMSNIGQRGYHAAVTSLILSQDIPSNKAYKIVNKKAFGYHLPKTEYLRLRGQYSMEDMDHDATA